MNFIDAQELHKKLNIKIHYSMWIQNYIITCKYKENIHYISKNNSQEVKRYWYFDPIILNQIEFYEKIKPEWLKYIILYQDLKLLKLNDCFKYWWKVGKNVKD